MRHPASYTCGVCGNHTIAVDNDVEDEDTSLPLGWLQVLVRRAVPNTHYRSAETILNQMVQEAIALVPPNTPPPTQADIDGLRAQLHYEAEKRANDGPDEVVVEEVELALCVECVTGLSAQFNTPLSDPQYVLADLADLDPDAFAQAGWFVPSAETPLTAPQAPEPVAPTFDKLPEGFGAPAEPVAPTEPPDEPKEDDKPQPEESPEAETDPGEARVADADQGGEHASA
jgi:hypothetical protein